MSPKKTLVSVVVEEVDAQFPSKVLKILSSGGVNSCPHLQSPWRVRS